MNEFRKNILKVHQKRHHEVKGSLGVQDAYKYYKHTGGTIDKKTYSTIIKAINTYYAQQLSLGNEIKLPHKMGVIELRKYKPTLKIDNGKLINTLPVDWDRTLKLWEEDEYSRNKKILIKTEVKEIFRIVYNKKTANYKNKSFFNFKANRELKYNLKNNIKEGAIDAFLWDG